MRFSPSKTLLTAILLCANLSAAHAGSFMVDPVRVELGPYQLSSALTLRNDDKEPAVIRIEARAWDQSGNEDTFEPSKEILVTPPIVTIPPGAEQIIRVALRRALDPQKELQYRIFMQEVPPPPRPGFSGLQVALRISVPVFVQPDSSVAAKPVWKVAYRAKDQILQVRLSNAGNAHVQMQEFRLSEPKKVAFTVQQASVYVLPGHSHEWTIKLDPSVRIAGTKVLLKAATDAGEVDQELDIETQ